MALVSELGHPIQCCHTNVDANGYRKRSFATHCSVEVAVLGLAAVVCVYQSGEAPGLPRGETDAFQGMNGGCLLF